MNKIILDFVIIASVLIGYFISIALITTSFYKSRANNYLSLSLFLIASLTLLEWSTMGSHHFAIQVLVSLRFEFLFAPILFTYFLIQVKHRLLNKRLYKWLYLPFFISVVLELCLYSFDLYASNIDILLYYAKDLAAIAVNVFLIFWGRRLIRNSKTLSKDKKLWLLRLNLFIIILILSWVLTRIEIYVFNSFNTFYFLRILLCIFLWWILYYGIFRLQVIVQKEEIHEYLVSNKAHNKTKSKIKKTTTTKIITQLYNLMEDEELYKDPLLSRLDLATHLGTSEGYLSQIINQEIKKSVIQFVNEYRIEEAKNLLLDTVFQKYSIEAIGLESGFKSKSAFYDVFKNNLQMSPGAYRKLHQTS